MRRVLLVQNNRLHRSVKPPIVSSFGDVALAVGPKFPMAKLPDVMKLLHEAAATVVPQVIIVCVCAVDITKEGDDCVRSHADSHALLIAPSSSCRMMRTW